MGVPLHILTQSQRFWYAQMVVAAVLADEEITKPETDFIKQILPIIKRPEDRQELMNQIASKKPPPIFRPPGVPPKKSAKPSPTASACLTSGWPALIARYSSSILSALN